MSTTHVGKIGRLPRGIRQILGERIEDGIPNKELVQWLNESETVQNLMAFRFGGRAITEQNLSEWKQTGHKEWLRREERRWLALQLTDQRDEEAMEPEESAGEKEISDRLGRELGMELARLAMELVNQEGSTEERWKRLCEVYREVSQMRRDDHRATRTRIQRERWEREQELQEAAEEEKELARKRQGLMAQIALPVSIALMTEAFRGGKLGQTMSEPVSRPQAGDSPAAGAPGRNQQAQTKLTRDGRPECARKGKRGNDEPRMTNGRERPKGAPTPDEVPSTDSEASACAAPRHDRPEKREEPESAEAQVLPAGGGPGESGVSEMLGIQPNPSKSNQNNNDEARMTND